MIKERIMYFFIMISLFLLNVYVIFTFFQNHGMIIISGISFVPSVLSEKFSKHVVTLFFKNDKSY